MQMADPSKGNASVIVDDTVYPEEPMFQDGVIGEAYTAAKVDHDTINFSSAGNSRNSGLAGTTDWVTTANHETLVDFQPGPGADTRLQMELIAGNNLLTLQWDDPYNGVVGAPTADLSIRIYDHLTGLLIVQTFDDNFATGQPLEVMIMAGNRITTPFSMLCFT
jgi:hypothetical protein